MANIIDYTYFIRDLNLPQAGTDEGKENINSFIDIYEREFLKRILGYDLWKAFTAGIAEVSPAQKWLDLRDGKEFTNLSNENTEWEGFKNARLRSPIANYVYFKFMTDNATNTAIIGEVKANSENASQMSPGRKMSRAWNEMLEMMCVLKEFLDANRSTYPEWDKYVFPYWHFRPINAFGI